MGGVSHQTDLRYAVSFRGTPQDRVRQAFGDRAIATSPGVTTVICRDVGTDGVQRVLTTLCDLGIDVLDVRAVGPAPGAAESPEGDGFRVAIRGALTIDQITCMEDPSQVRPTDDVVTLVARDRAELARVVQVVHDHGLALIGVSRRDRPPDG